MASYMSIYLILSISTLPTEFASLYALAFLTIAILLRSEILLWVLVEVRIDGINTS